MMQFYNKIFLLILSLVFVITLFYEIPSAQEDIYVLSHQDIFLELKRAPVNFQHTLHEEALSEEGCGACHHVFDEQKKQLVYEEDEEQECKSCHGIQKESAKPSLREAFHKSCTGCHRKLKKTKIEKNGPTTCGECHKKE
jgi:Class III cytochrome C family